MRIFQMCKMFNKKSSSVTSEVVPNKKNHLQNYFKQKVQTTLQNNHPLNQSQKLQCCEACGMGVETDKEIVVHVVVVVACTQKKNILTT